MKNKFYLFLGLLWLALAPAAKAQLVCNITLPAQHDSIENYFLAFSNAGNYCTAVELENSGIPSPGHIPTVRLIFQHSTDGGRTWKRQDPGIIIPYDNFYYVNEIDQIDSANVVAVGDSAFVLRTTDGGESWHKQDLPLYTHIFDVNFANPKEGMLIGGGR